ncbi:type II toxin-antitoxin system HicA family toxin [Campylobacter jejuni]|uniref:type II toxin-antitoxin system HicA family toxin n=1 Tax=Campylobacter jejuni TaxID=197 RepID=UPI0035A2B892
MEKLLSWYGYKLVSIRGSHHKFKKDNKSIIVPLHKPIKEFYVKQILKLLKDEK